MTVTDSTYADNVLWIRYKKKSDVSNSWNLKESRTGQTVELGISNNE